MTLFIPLELGIGQMANLRLCAYRRCNQWGRCRKSTGECEVESTGGRKVDLVDKWLEEKKDKKNEPL